MLTIPLNQEPRIGDYPCDCDYCGVRWMRSDMRMTYEGLLACPDESGCEAQECLDANVELQVDYDISLDKDRGTAHDYAQEATAVPLGSLLVEPELLSPVAWWKAGEGLVGDSSGLVSWTDTVSGYRFLPVSGSPTVAAPAALGGFRVVQIDGEAGDRFDADAPLNTWSRLHDGSGFMVAMAFRTTMGLNNIIRTINGGTYGFFAYMHSDGRVIWDIRAESGAVISAFSGLTPSIGRDSLVVVATGMKRFKRPYEFEHLVFTDGQLRQYIQAQMSYYPELGTTPHQPLHIGTGAANAIVGEVCEVAVGGDFTAQELFAFCCHLSRKFRREKTVGNP